MQKNNNWIHELLGTHLDMKWVSTFLHGQIYDNERQKYAFLIPVS